MVEARMHGTKDEFIAWAKKVAGDKNSKEYLEFYHYLNAAFIEADTNKDGAIDPREFDGIIARAAFQPRRYGLAPREEDLFKSDKERLESRTKMFKEIDVNHDGMIAFNEFLEFCFNHVKAKVAAL